ncbi:MAG: twin-arginine translocation signal domain-containing protein, partial [Candidatus Sulfotelmatobacter sp.]
MARRISRRTFLQAATATSAATYAARSLPAWASSNSNSPDSASAGSAAVDRGTVAVDTPLASFAYSEVKLLDGPMKLQFEQNHARFLNLDDDRLLKVFRQVAGLP